MIRERGSALVAVLVVSMLSSMIAVSLLYRLLADEHASKAGLGARKAWEAAMSGVEVAAAVAHRHFLDPTRWRDRPEIFHAQLVSDDGVDRWYFTVYSPGDAPAADGESSVRYGLSDEGARFNLRMIPREVLASIPGLDDALAGALFAATGRETPAVEAPDATNAADGGGDAAEAPLSYTLRNAPFRTLDEIALVPGFGVELLYGEDADGDGRLDPEEDDGATRPPNDDGDGVLDGGLRDWLTVWNVGLAVDANRVPQVDLNRDVERLGELELSDGTLRFLALSRKQAQEAGLDQAFIHPVELLDARIEVPIEEDG
ncbi:MAG TPA: hypothetical protein VK116_19880, partial [Planctomycetota bacterium]|nr:hypothetical protein [Planctomycetota bacterium]